MYDIAFLGRIIPKDIKTEVLKNTKNTLNASSENLQWKLIEGLDAANKSPVKIFSYLPVQSYPQGYLKKCVKKHYFSHTKDAKDISLPFINIAYIKRLFMSTSVVKELKKWAAQKTNKQKVIISYSLTPEFLKAIKAVKKINAQVQSCAVVIDLPQYTILENKISLSSKVYLRWYEKKTFNKLNYIDSFVLLTRQMADKVALNGQRYIVMEGISETNIPPILLSEKDDAIKKIFHAGKLNNKFGINHLIEAFKKTQNSKYRLVIYGKGDSESDIIENAKNDKRIIFKGLKEREIVLKDMMTSDLIINPRRNNEDFTKYSFPSKNMEALSTGIPFIGYKLDGIGDEYDNYINYPQSDSAESLAALVDEVLQDESGKFAKRAERAKEEMFARKDKYTQTERILQMIKNS